MYEINEDGCYVEFHLSGTVNSEDFETIIPHLEQRVHTYGKIRVLINAKDLSGMTPGAIWEELKFDIRHLNDIERTAIVGDKAWEKWIAMATNFISSGTTKYFELSEEESARAWVKADM